MTIAIGKELTSKALQTVGGLNPNIPLQLQGISASQSSPWLVNQIVIWAEEFSLLRDGEAGHISLRLKVLSQPVPVCLSVCPAGPARGHAPLTAVNAYVGSRHCFLSSFGLCWLRQLIKNSIFISPIIHFDFIVEWVVGLATKGGRERQRERERGERMGPLVLGRRKVSSGRGVNSLFLLLLSLSVHNFKVFALLSCTLTSTARGQGRGGTRRKGGEKLSLWLSAFCILTGWQFNIYIRYLFCGLLINARTRVQPTLNASVIKNINAMADAKCESFNGYAMNTQQSSSVCVSLCPCGPRVKREFFLAWPTGHS